MKANVLDEISARRFLLEELSPEEKAQVEEEAFLNPDSFAFLQAAEDDLIDEFLKHDLSADERERFESYFLSQPGRRANLRIAQAFHKYVSQSRSSAVSAARADNSFKGFSMLSWLGIRGNPLRLALAASAILIAVAAIWIAMRTLRQPQSQPPIRAQQQVVPSPEPTETVSAFPSQSPNSPTPTNIHNKPSSPLKQSPTVFSVLLVPGGLVRGETSVTEVHLPPTSAVARLELPLIEKRSFKKYQATLQTGEGEVIRKWTNLSPRTLESGEGVQISVPTRLLGRLQKYRVILGGISFNGKVNEISSYYFQVDD